MTTQSDAVARLRAALIELTPSQRSAIEALAAGATHADAAEVAGVARETVTRWSGHHPGFQAAQNMYAAAIALEQSDRIRQILGKALAVIDRELDDADLGQALAVIKAIPFPAVGMLDPDGIIDTLATITYVRQLPLPPQRDRNGRIDLAAQLTALECAETSDERAERTTVERLVIASLLIDDSSGQPVDPDDPSQVKT